MLVLISGIKGQLASYLADLYTDKGHTVVGFERRSAIPDYSNIQHLIGSSQFVIENADITDLSSIISLVVKYKPDLFINCAAQSFVAASYKEPISTTEINTMGVLNCLEALRQCSPKTKFLNLSTSEVYGEVLETPQNENTKPNPVSPYAASKLAAEIMIDTYRKTYGLWAGYVRVFNMESPRRSKQFVTRKITSWLADAFTTVEKHVFAFLEDRKTEQNFISVQNGFDLALKNGAIKKIQLGNLLAKRDWQHCFDAAVGISKILDKEEFELYVLGTGETYSIEDFLRMAFEVVGVSNWRDFVEISEAYMRPSEVNLLLSDPSKARKELGWISTYDIKRIVSEMVFTDIERNRNAVSVGSRPN